MAGVVERAQAIPFRPLEAEALLRRGFLEAELSRYDAAEATLESAYAAARAAGDDETARDVATRLVWVVGYRRERWIDGERWSRLAFADLERTGSPADGEIALRGSIESMLEREGKYDEAIDEQKRVLALL